MRAFKRLRPPHGILVILMLCFFMGLADSVTGAEQPRYDGERTVIRKIMQRFVNLWNKDDAKALTMLFVPNGEFIGSQGSMTKTRPKIQKLLTKEREEVFQGTVISKWIDTIDFKKPHMASVTGIYELRGVDVAFGLVEAAGTGTFMCKFTNHNGQWMIMRAQITRD